MARNRNRSDDPLHGGTLQVPRSRGAVSGILLIVLGAWGALIPLVGPAFKFGLSPDKSWQLTSARFWLEILPGAVTVLGGLLLLLAANRITASLGAWLGVAGGAWFIVGISLASLLHIGSPGTPTGKSKLVKAIESLALFTGLGAIILFIAAAAVGRLSVRSVRDVRAAQQREAQAAAAAEEEQRRQVALEEQQRRDGAYEDQLRREGAENERKRLAEQQQRDEQAGRERQGDETRIRQDQQHQDTQMLQQQRGRDAQLAGEQQQRDARFVQQQPQQQPAPPQQQPQQQQPQQQPQQPGASAVFPPPGTSQNPPNTR